MLSDDDDYDGDDDDDDDYYEDDEEYEEGGGGRGVVLALIAALVLVALGGVFVGIIILSGMGKDDDGTATLATDAPGDGAVTGDGVAVEEPDEDDLLSDDGGLDLGFVEGDEVVEETPEPREEFTPDNSWREETPAPRREERRVERSTPAPRSSTREAPSQRRETETRSSRSAPPPREESTPAPTRSSRKSSGDTRDPWDDGGGGSSSSGSSSSSGGSSSGTTVTVSSSESAEENTPRPGSVVEDEPAPARGDDSRTYEKESIASLGMSASDGKLDADEIRFLQAIPSDHGNFTLAWATVMKNAESKRDYRGHCEASEQILALSQNKYHPEWNLEMGKCHMRNGRWDQAVSSIDRTLTDSMGMTGSTKVTRLLTAYEVKAVSKTALYDANAIANSGAVDDGKLSAAIQAWSEYRNYASGVGNTRALQKAEREIADLSARRDP